MKKWLMRIGIVVLLLVGGLFTLAFWMDSGEAVVSGHVRNEAAKTIKPGFEGTPVDQNGAFMNLEYPFKSKILDLLKWRINGNPQAEEKENDTERLPIADPNEFLKSDRDGILWLGHASFYIRLSGKGILIDPVFGDPSFITPYLHVPSPIDVIDRVDYILLSHDHRDHTDEPTLREVTAKFPDAMLLAGLGTEGLLNEWKTPTNPIQTVGWYQQFNLPDDEVKIYFMPVRHWSRRGLTDMNKRLWGGYVIQNTDNTIYFGGDSGYGSHYKELAELFPKVDFFIIGIGGYSPRWFMEPNHNTPEEAIQAYTDAKATALIPMHFGRFSMSDEPPSEPLKLLNQKAEELGILHKILSLDIYESTDCGCSK